MQEYLADPEMNAGRVYERAGYRARGAGADACASRLLRNVKVRAAIDGAQQARAERMQVTADSILERLNEVATRCMQGVPVLDRHGEPTGEWRFDSTGANRSLELLGKHVGLFTDRVDLSVRRVLVVPEIGESPPVTAPPARDSG